MLTENDPTKSIKQDKQASPVTLYTHLTKTWFANKINNFLTTHRVDLKPLDSTQTPNLKTQENPMANIREHPQVEEPPEVVEE